MMKVVTTSQMAHIDRKTIDGGIPGAVLMERAGLAVFNEVIKMLGEGERKKILVVCGRGNNGGDGFVVARFLKREGHSPMVLLAGGREGLKGDAEIWFMKAMASRVQIHDLIDSGDLEQYNKVLNTCDLVVDAILGTGLKGAPSGIIKDSIQWLDGYKGTVISVDIPSGVDGSTGEIPGVSVEALRTVTFGLPKLGHYFYPGRGQRGLLKVVDIGLSEDAVQEEEGIGQVMDEENARSLLPGRHGDEHKGDCGKIFVLAGSVGMTGAACLASRSVLLSGAGVVILGIPASLNDICEVKLTEVMTHPLPELRKKRSLALRGLGEVRKIESWADVLVVGPGLGRWPETGELVRRLLGSSSKPCVLDADGLEVFKGRTEELTACPGVKVITPHYGELSRLFGWDIAVVKAYPLERAKQAASILGKVVLLKGAPTLIADPEGELYINPTGNVGMATAGSGDVLAGLIGGFLAQGLFPFVAARVGAYVHGLAGDLGAEKKGYA